MSAVGSVGSLSAGQGAAPASAHAVQAGRAVPGREAQEDSLSISSQGLKALDDPVALVVLGKHHHRPEVEMELLTYPNFQLAGKGLPVAQAQLAGAAQHGGQAQGAAVPSVGAAGAAGGAAGGAGGAGAGGGGH